MARSTFYYYLKQLDQPDKYASLKSAVRYIYLRHKGRYGYRRITSCLMQSGVVINHKTVLKIMKMCGLKSLIRRKKYKSYKGQQGKIASNLLNRNFKASRPYKKLVTDVTEFAVDGAKLYLSPIMDLYNGEIISYNLSERPDFAQIMDMLHKAFVRIPEKARPILHSDQGWQYQMRLYQGYLKGKKVKISMSRKGNCLDNAAMESFFSILKSELFYTRKFDSISTLKREIIKFIDYYNNDRIKLKLNGLSPVNYRTQAA